jgi:hypothetical protein
VAKDSDQLAGTFEAEKTGGVLAGLLAEENGFDRRALWRIGTWGTAAVAAVIIAVMANQTSLGWRRDQATSADLARHAQQLQSIARESQNETRRLAAAIDTLNSDRDRLYSRVTVLEQGLDSVTGTIARQNTAAGTNALAAAMAAPPSASPASTASVAPADSQPASANAAGAPAIGPVATTATVAAPPAPEAAPVPEKPKMDMAKIEAKPEPKPEAKVEAKVEAKSEPKARFEPRAKGEAKNDAKNDTKNEPRIEPKVEPKLEPKSEAKSEAKLFEARPKSEPKLVEPRIEPKSDIKSEIKVGAKPEPKNDFKPEPKSEQASAPAEPVTPTVLNAPASAMTMATLASPSGTIAGTSISIMGPPDPAAGKFIESAKSDNAGTAPVADALALVSPKENDASETGSAKLPVQRTDFAVDLGSANSVNGLRALWRGLRSKAELAQLRPIIVVKEGNTGLGMQLRLAAGPLHDAATAAKICATLVESERPCETTVFDGQRLAMSADEAQPPPAAKPMPSKSTPYQYQYRRNMQRHGASQREEAPAKPEASTSSFSLFGGGKR